MKYKCFKTLNPYFTKGKIYDIRFCNPSKFFIDTYDDPSKGKYLMTAWFNNHGWKHLAPHILSINERIKVL